MRGESEREVLSSLVVHIIYVWTSLQLPNKSEPWEQKNVTFGVICLAIIWRSILTRTQMIAVWWRMEESNMKTTGYRGKKMTGVWGLEWQKVYLFACFRTVRIWPYSYTVGEEPVQTQEVSTAISSQGPSRPTQPLLSAERVKNITLSLFTYFHFI